MHKFCSFRLYSAAVSCQSLWCTDAASNFCRFLNSSLIIFSRQCLVFCSPFLLAFYSYVAPSFASVSSGRHLRVMPTIIKITIINLPSYTLQEFYFSNISCKIVLTPIRLLNILWMVNGKHKSRNSTDIGTN
jgi:hypothetical protein